MKYETHSLISAVWLADGKVSTGMINVLLYPSWTVTRPMPYLSFLKPSPLAPEKLLKCIFGNKSWLKCRSDIHRGYKSWKTALAKLCEKKKRSLTCQELVDLIWWRSESINSIYFCKWNSNGYVVLGFSAPRSFKTPHACFLRCSAPVGWNSAHSHPSPGQRSREVATKLNKPQIQVQEEFAPLPCYMPLLKTRCAASWLGSGQGLTFDWLSCHFSILLHKP